MEFVGIVKWFNDAKGFGFIEPEHGGCDVFAHFSSIQMDGFRTLKQGARVLFEQEDGPKGKHARNIRPITDCHGSMISDVEIGRVGCRQDNRRDEHTRDDRPTKTAL